MELPPLVEYGSEQEYRDHFVKAYCRGVVTTFDGINVRFRRGQFDHCFFESSRRDASKDEFSRQRARRVDWIKAVLKSDEAELYQGWDREKRRHDPQRRVAVVLGEYVVIIALKDERNADFVTAFVASSPEPGRLSAVQLIRRGPKWT